MYNEAVTPDSLPILGYCLASLLDLASGAPYISPEKLFFFSKDNTENNRMKRLN
jgi:hypothetical protein